MHCESLQTDCYSQMLPHSRTRFSNIFAQRSHFLSSHLLQFKLYFSTSSSFKGSRCIKDEDCDDFLPWLRRKSGVEISSVLSNGKSDFGRSLYASKPVATGDCILRVPYNVQLASDNLHPQIDSLLIEDVGHVSRLAIVILLEQKKGQDSAWGPYVTRLPQPWEMHNTIFWTRDELEMIRQSPVYFETINFQAQIEKEFLSISSVLNHFPASLEDITLQDFMHAYALVGSRAWGSNNGVSLIPFADFLNHDGEAEASVLSNDDKQISEVISDRDYASGEQVFITYGKFSNATLLLDFGFTLPSNKHDQVQMQLSIPLHDPLHMMKSELLKRHYLPAGKDANQLSSTWDTFTIKEVKSARGKGRGIPQSLRAFARVLCCTSRQELHELALEAAQHDGRLARRPFEDTNQEMQAHKNLLSWVTELIGEYESSVKSLEYQSSHSASESFALRRQMARDLLTGELRVLKSAAAWLDAYCTRLLAETTVDDEALMSL
ncbi:SET domain [Dillenia turbinata]|uniref:SET domain n=1 Tax=Dillenia turbinata TaxID=194707 RepID=A0AAN8ZD38_9MAGN